VTTVILIAAPLASAQTRPSAPIDLLSRPVVPPIGEPHVVHPMRAVGVEGRHWPDPPGWWTRAAMCVHSYESTDWHAEGYFSGGFQFLDSTWQAVGGHGRAGYASVPEQIYRAWLLYRQVGWTAWPNTARICGLD